MSLRAHAGARARSAQEVGPYADFVGPSRDASTAADGASSPASWLTRRTHRVVLPIAPSMLAAALRAACSDVTSEHAAGVPALSSVGPEVIALPDGFFPEGITGGRGAAVFAGSLFDGLNVRVDLRTGAVELAAPPQVDRIAVRVPRCGEPTRSEGLDGILASANGLTVDLGPADRSVGAWPCGGLRLTVLAGSGWQGSRGRAASRR